MGVSSLWRFSGGVRARVPPQLLTRRLCGHHHLQDRPAKKARSGPEEPGSPAGAPLSPEQLVRIQRNKAAALLRLAARNVPPGLGESWKQRLSAEFGKPYFIKVRRGGEPWPGPPAPGQ